MWLNSLTPHNPTLDRKSCLNGMEAVMWRKKEAVENGSGFPVQGKFHFGFRGIRRGFHCFFP